MNELSARLLRGLRAHAKLKLVCHAVLSAWIALWYYSPQVWPLFPAVPAPMLGVDAWVPFSPSWALWYQSVFLVHSLALWLPGEAVAVRRYAALIASAYALSAIAFWLYPTLSPRPASCENFLYQWLVLRIDGPCNALPSLHAAMATLAAVQLGWHVRSLDRGRLACRAALAIWWLGLLYSTLATRQHRLLDLAAGIVLAALLAVLPPFRAFLPRRAQRRAAITGPCRSEKCAAAG